MMSNRSADIVFHLIKSLEKAEKRHFKLYITRNSAKQDLKIIQLFDAMDKLEEYDEKWLLKKMGAITKPQLANMKTHLYKQVLASLRLLKTAESTDLQLSEQLDYARILYHKGLKLQALKILEKAKELAKANSKFNYLAQVISLEKKIENLHITRTSQEKIEQITQESLNISEHIQSVSKLSNLALLLYRWYTQHGHARNPEDEIDVKAFFKQHLPKQVEKITDFYELLYLYQAHCWYAFIRQDFLMYYRYSQKWIDLYIKQPEMIMVETGHYIKGMHNLLNAHFDLRNFKAFEQTLAQFEAFEKTEVAQLHDNFRTHTSIYINSAKINRHLMMGTFEAALPLVPAIETKLAAYELYVDRHRILIFNYKFALLYFGAGKFDTCIDYLHRIIHGPVDLRNDLQSYSRLLHLMAHYELGNYDLMDSLTKSVYRFMAKMESFTVVEEQIFKFLRQSFNLSPRQMKPELEKLLQNVKHLENNRYQTRTLAYLDVISWLESKVQGTTMSQVIQQKYQTSKHR